MSADRHTIPLHGTVAANSVLTKASKKIGFPFKIYKVRVSFPPGTQRRLQVKIFATIDSLEPTSGEPHGKSLLGMFSSTDYVIGDNESVTFPVTSRLPEGYYLKAYGLNMDGDEHTLDVSFFIEST